MSAAGRGFPGPRSERSDETHPGRAGEGSVKQVRLNEACLPA